jgi:LacI family transcriptional regulator
VGFDNAAAASKLTEMVIAQGHRRIAMIAGISEMNDRAAARMLGVRGLGGGRHRRWPLRVIEAAYAFQDGAGPLAQLMQAKPSADSGDVRQ